MIEHSQIDKWKHLVEKRRRLFDTKENIHDFIDYKKHCWLIEGFNEGIKQNSCDVEQMEDQELIEQYKLFAREMYNRRLVVEE